jgi:hypothetical protein
MFFNVNNPKNRERFEKSLLGEGTTSNDKNRDEDTCDNRSLLSSGTLDQPAAFEEMTNQVQQFFQWYKERTDEQTGFPLISLGNASEVIEEMKEDTITREGTQEVIDIGPPKRRNHLGIYAITETTIQKDLMEVMTTKTEVPSFEIIRDNIIRDFMIQVHELIRYYENLGKTDNAHRHTTMFFIELAIKAMVKVAAMNVVTGKRGNRIVYQDTDHIQIRQGIDQFIQNRILIHVKQNSRWGDWLVGNPMMPTLVILMEKMMDGCFGVYGEPALPLIEGKINKNNYSDNLVNGMITLGRYLRQDQTLKLKGWSIPKEAAEYVGITLKDIELDVTYDTPKESEISKLTEDPSLTRVLLTSRTIPDDAAVPTVVTTSATKRNREVPDQEKNEPAKKISNKTGRRRIIEDEEEDTEDEGTVINLKSIAEEVPTMVTGAVDVPTMDTGAVEVTNLRPDTLEIPRTDIEAIDSEQGANLTRDQRKELRRYVRAWIEGIGKGENGDTTPEGIQNYQDFVRKACEFNEIQYNDSRENVLWVLTQLYLIMDKNEFTQCLHSNEIEVPRGAPWVNAFGASGTGYMNTPPDTWFDPFQCEAVKEILGQYTVEEIVTQQHEVMASIQSVVTGIEPLQVMMFLHFMISTHIPNYKYVIEMIAKDEYETPPGYIHAHFEGNTSMMINNDFPFKLG